MITAVTLSIALGFEPAEAGVMKRAPRKASAAILSPFLIWRIIFVAMLIVTCVFGLFMLQLHGGVSLQAARTVAVNMLVFGEIVYLFNCRKLHSAMWRAKHLLDSKPTLIAISITITFQLLFTYLPIMQKFFGSAALDISQWFYIVVLSLCVFALVEIEKIFMRRSAIKSSALNM